MIKHNKYLIILQISMTKFRKMSFALIRILKKIAKDVNRNKYFIIKYNKYFIIIKIEQ